MPRGGARIGAGRKPKRQVAEVAPFQPVVVDGGRVEEINPNRPPDDLITQAHDFWLRYAAQAVEARTLTPRTVASFRLLCELDAEMRATKATIEKDGRTYVKVTVDGAGQEHEELKAHPLTGAYRQLAQRVEMLMARFGLAPFGKPLAPAKKAKHWLESLTG